MNGKMTSSAKRCNPTLNHPMCLVGKISIGSKTGLFMRVLDDLIKYKRANSKSSHVVITIAILEIHRENLKDLLNKSKLVDLQRNRYGDEAVPNIAMTEVSTLQDCFDVFQIGNANRSVAQTAMNDVSSRSHAVFMIDILQQEKTAQNPEPPDPIALYAAEFVNEPASVCGCVHDGALFTKLSWDVFVDERRVAGTIIGSEA